MKSCNGMSTLTHAPWSSAGVEALSRMTSPWVSLPPSKPSPAKSTSLSSRLDASGVQTSTCRCVMLLASTWNSTPTKLIVRCSLTRPPATVMSLVELFGSDHVVGHTVDTSV